MKARLALAAGALASLGLALGAPGLATTPLRATLVALPAAAGLLAFVRSALRARPSSPAERLLAAAWLVLALHEERLALRFGGELLAGTLASLLAWRVARLLPALARRLSGRGSEGSGSSSGGWQWPFAAIPLAVGLALLPWVHRAAPPNGDEPYFLLLAESLASEGDFDLADEYRDSVASRFTERPVEPQPGDRTGPSGEPRSRHESLLAFYLVPFWLAGGAFGGRLGILVLWALLAERLLALVRRSGVGPRGALLAWALASFTPPVAVYAGQIWIEIPAALALTIALERWARSRAAPECGSWRADLGFALALVALPLLKLRLVALAAPIALLRLFERRRQRAALAGLAALGALVALVLWRNERMVGRALGLYELSDFVRFDQPLSTYLLRLDGLLFDLGFGLVAAGPIWLLALAGLPRVPAWRGVAGRALLAALPYLALVVSLRSWYGGWCPPFRYGLVLVPILAIGLGCALDRRPRAGELLLGWTLGWATALAALAFVVGPGWATSFADGRSRLLDLAAEPFAADLARLLPSALRPRTATWLGPAVALLALGLVSRGARRRRGAPALAVPELVGVAVLLVGFAAGIAAAHILPSKAIELEDPWVAPGIGALYPDPWTIDRPRYGSGRALDAAARPLEIVPIRGGSRVAIRLVYRAHPDNRASAVLVVATASGAELARRTLAPGASWRTETFAELEWPADERLRLAVAPVEPAESATAAVVIDRVELAWR